MITLLIAVNENNTNGADIRRRHICHAAPLRVIIIDDYDACRHAMLPIRCS